MSLTVPAPWDAVDAARSQLHEGLWIVVPTYNEIESLPRLLPDVLNMMDLVGEDGRVLVVDDASPDGTGAWADAYAAEQDRRVGVLHRVAKTGLGDAYMSGFAATLRGGATTVVQMDADGSHDPAAVPRLLAAVRDGADLALGSRYVASGSTPDWSLRRRVLSRGGSAYARLALGLPQRDLTGGFKCWSREALERVTGTPLRLQGYGFQIELTHRAVVAGLRVAEVPICFRDRRAGESKLGAGTIREALTGVPALRVAAS